MEFDKLPSFEEIAWFAISRKDLQSLILQLCGLNDLLFVTDKQAILDKQFFFEMAVNRRALGHLISLILLNPSVESSDTVTVSKKKSLDIGHLNVCGSFAKTDLLFIFIKKHDFDIFGVTETLLKESLPTPLVEIEGYNFERRDRGKAGGGVGVYLKTNILEDKTRDVIIEWIFSKYKTTNTRNVQLKTLIDVILSNNPGSPSINEVIPCTLSDHDVIHCVRKFKKKKNYHHKQLNVVTTQTLSKKKCKST